MSKLKYIGVFEEDDDISIAYPITSNLKKIKRWKSELDEIGADEITIKIYQLKEIQ